jgi:hypothetical protein
MKIAQKLGLLVGTLLVAMLATIVVLSAQITATSNEYDSLIKNQLAQRAAARTMLVEFGKQVQYFQQILLQANSPETFAPLKARYEAQTVKVDETVSELLRNVGP